MKRLALVLALLSAFLWAGTAQAQSENIVKLKGVQFAKYTDEEWSDWQDCSDLIVVDVEKETIVIYDEGDPVNFDIVKMAQTGDGVMSFKFVDDDGDTGVITLQMTGEDVPEDEEDQLYIDYDEYTFRYVYHIEYL